ncbi:MAG TPA: NTP transferase domain-containing protein, partial [Candidatus Binataceae bacterium]
MEDRNLAAIVLAAGLGTRMRSKHAKVLHPLGGRPMIARSLRAVSALDARPIVVVVGHQAAEVEAAVRANSETPLTFALQPRLLGTGDSARHGLAAIPEHFTGDVLIGYGDVPMVTSATLAAFWSAHRQSGAALSLVSVRVA